APAIHSRSLHDALPIFEETANGGNHDEVQSGNLSLDLADYANIEDATLTGTGNLDLTGNDDRNRLTGNDGDNTIFGGLGGDILRSEEHTSELQSRENIV